MWCTLLGHMIIMWCTRLGHMIIMWCTLLSHMIIMLCTLLGHMIITWCTLLGHLITRVMHIIRLIINWLYNTGVCSPMFLWTLGSFFKKFKWWCHALNNDLDNQRPFECELTQKHLWANHHFNTLQGKEHLLSQTTRQVDYATASYSLESGYEMWVTRSAIYNEL